MYEKVAILITQIWYKAKCYFYKCEPDHCSKYGKKYIYSSLRYHNKLIIYEKIAINTQIWHKAKFYFMCIRRQWYLIMVPNMKKIHPAVMEECARMDRLGPVLHVYSPIPL